ncbi:glycosyltransferase [Lewinella sp. JB7]|uniref:glycosyltransferase n=1 Tax=Lewinella sp. JB7 TaxID=2962887 RepID=UPI0020C9FFF9|nr:glycosyltransferase [Lewinella sp. JB7]MCP9237286.1 hypothetical protein [Lewinella sp. JB7]
MNAYVSLVSTDDYVDGLLCMAMSLLDTQPRYPLVVMTSPRLSPEAVGRIEGFGLATLPLTDRYRLPDHVREKNEVPRWLGTFAKLEMFELTQYAKIVFLDADMLVTRNLDHLFDCPHPSAAVYQARVPPFEHWNFPNTGLLVISPRRGLGQEIFATWPTVHQQFETFSEQNLIHEYFRGIFRERRGPWEISVMYNACAFILDKIIRQENLNLNLRQPDDRTVAVVHFTSPNKPWAMSLSFLAYFILRKTAGGRWNELRAYRRYHYYLRRVRRKT